MSKISASSSTLKGGPPWPPLAFMGTGMGWGREGTEPGGPPRPAESIAAAMFCVLGEKDWGKLLGFGSWWG